ncbi:hypothetical protein DICPUDRAFT_74305 [Dictyostelium purpureum]|uniref:Alternative oxidase n=1 Tax=Dictyostelium purpureum TaxID=5786 RepID=F0Z7C5_DICPU|nr:uncharacterized protein DICPUDRAFT_74305 [Dictyostelium purpureum]EGC40116.1 hypothetical protein DICPUDRAFT_74305 [Dictyostelium purpureum]|eukprot:XP_003283306.1 hypothetical protein DICPUDRAFT_74305 [Dictyostelium purpureum]
MTKKNKTKTKNKTNNINRNNNNKNNKNNIININNNDTNNGNYNLIEKKQNPQYHRNSTLYTYTPKSVLKRIEKQFIQPKFYEPKTIGDHFAYYTVIGLKKFSEIMFTNKHINFAIVLESIASVPGLCGGVILHLRALRTMESCSWIKTLMDEAENERIHLMVFIELTKATLFERILVTMAQFIVWFLYFIGYIISPKTMHRIVSYLEYEAVKTYTNFIKDIDLGLIENVPASKLAIEYWGLDNDATLRDMILVIRQDEVDHNIVNHQISKKILKNNNDPVILENKFNKISFTDNLIINNNNNNNNYYNNNSNNSNYNNCNNFKDINMKKSINNIIKMDSIKISPDLTC